MTASSLRVFVGPGLAFRFELAESLLHRVERFLDYFPGADASGGPPPAAPPPVRVTSDPPPEEVPAGDVLLEEPPLVVRRAGELTLLELPNVRAWCDASLGRAGICLRQPSESELDLFIGLALAPMLIELAPSRGWLGVHAAGVAIEGRGILLPGPSGAGKSTIFANVHRAGHGVLSDDLVWLRPAARGTTMYAFPRGVTMPGPTADAVALQAIVCPVITGDAGCRLLPLAFARALQILLEQGGFLTSGATAGDRFRSLVRVARSAPAYRLEAGRRRREAPAFLADLAASIAVKADPRDGSSRLRSASRTRPAGSPRQRQDSR